MVKAKGEKQGAVVTQGVSEVSVVLVLADIGQSLPVNA
jgi:hypothetical protein